MTFSFEDSRCKEIVEAAAARMAGETSKEIPLEVRITILLTIRVETAAALDPRISRLDRASILDSQARMLFLLIPELQTEDGVKAYKAIASAFLRDMKDLAKNHE